jgi:hypothetical protein
VRRATTSHGIGSEDGVSRITRTKLVYRDGRREERWVRGGLRILDDGARKARTRERREEKRREIASLSSCPKLWHGKARSTMRRRRALVDLFGVVEMLIGERIRPGRVPLLQVFSA